MNNVRHQQRGLQRLLAAMALAAILETAGIQPAAADQSVRANAKSNSTSGIEANANGNRASDGSSESAWRPRRSSGKWTAGTGKPEPISSKAGVKTGSRTASNPSTLRPTEDQPTRRTPSLVFITGRSTDDTSKPAPAEKVPHQSGHDAPAPLSSAAPTNTAPYDDLDTSRHDAAPEVTLEHPSPSEADFDRPQNSTEAEYRDGDDGESRKSSADGKGPTYFDSPAETMPGSSPEESLDDQPVISSTERLKQMFAEKERLRNGEVDSEKVETDSLHPTPGSSPAGEFQSFGTHPTLEADLQSSDPAERQLAQRVLRIRQQILHLKAQARQAVALKSQADGATSREPSHSTFSTDPHGDDATPSQTESQDRDSSAMNSDEVPEDHSEGTSQGNLSSPPLEHDESNSDDSGVDPSEVSEEDGTGDGMETTEPEAGHVPTDSTDGMIAIGDPIDRVGLSNNLYALGEYPAAHDAYLSVDVEQLPSEQQFWVEYQIANCLRRMGESAAASNQFRKLAAQPEAGWISEQAAWWVEILEQIRLTEKSLQEDAAEATSVPQKKLPLSGIPNKG